jgi:hypothetical protein
MEQDEGRFGDGADSPGADADSSDSSQGLESGFEERVRAIGNGVDAPGLGECAARGLLDRHAQRRPAAPS